MDNTSAVAVVNQYLDIMLVQNRQGEGLENVLTDDFQFDDPFGTASSAREFTSYVQRWIATPKSLHMKHHFVDGDQVCSIYTIDVANASGARASFDIADLFELHGGRIAKEKVFFANPVEFARHMGFASDYLKRS
jgi:hypothetical protein